MSIFKSGREFLNKKRSCFFAIPSKDWSAESGSRRKGKCLDTKYAPAVFNREIVATKTFISVFFGNKRLSQIDIFSSPAPLNGGIVRGAQSFARIHSDQLAFVPGVVPSKRNKGMENVIWELLSSRFNRQKMLTETVEKRSRAWKILAGTHYWSNPE